jgi:hypothetical protein
MVMPAALRRAGLHVLLAMAWVILAPRFALRYLESLPSTPDVTVWAGQALGVVALISAGLLALLWSWLRQDALARGLPRSTAWAYALASIPSAGLAVLAYLYHSRGRREATLAAVLYLALYLALLTLLARAP